MKLRRFVAQTTTAALAQVREALGPDAMILETRSVPGAGGAVEVIAAVDDAPATEMAPAGPDAALAAEVRELSGLVRTFVAGTLGACAKDLGPELAQLYLSLVSGGVGGVIAASLIEETAERVTGGASIDVAVAAAVGSGISFGPPDDFAVAKARRRKPGMFMFIGPPGDGKTTTVAKLAGRATLAGRRRVALVSTDTYRIGGAEELAAYARILGVPHATVSDGEDLRRSLEGFGDVDQVFIDTAGLSLRDGDQRAELRAMADAVKGIRRTLVVSATAAPLVTRRVCAAASDLHPDACIVTKVDEAPATAALGALWGRGVRLAFFGTGRTIPRDLETASPDRMAAWLRAA